MTAKIINSQQPGDKTQDISNNRCAAIREYRQQAVLLRKVNLVLKALLIAGVPATGWYGFQLYKHDYRANMVRLDKLGSVRIEQKEAAATSFEPETFDLSFLDQRNIFARYQVQDTQEARASTKDAYKFKSSIRVVGITFDKDYEVLIEDLDKKETVLLTKGKSIAGATLVEISEKKLVFELDHNRIELEL